MAAITHSEFWGPNDDAYSLLRNKQPALDRARRVVPTNGYRAMRALVDALLGAATGGAALATHVRVNHNVFGHGVASPSVETVTDINRVTTAADVTAAKEFLVNVTSRPAFPADLSGNGGPALA